MEVLVALGERVAALGVVKKAAVHAAALHTKTDPLHASDDRGSGSSDGWPFEAKEEVSYEVNTAARLA